MDTKREKILIEVGLESACHKAGKIFIQGEFVSCKKFRLLFDSSAKLPHSPKQQNTRQVGFQVFVASKLVIQLKVRQVEKQIQPIGRFIDKTLLLLKLQRNVII